MSLLIELKDISKEYAVGETKFLALKKINLSINTSEFIAIMGTSGSGKSTIMNIIGLLDRPTVGSYLLDGKEVSKLSDDEQAFIRNQKIGFVFQSFFLLPRLSSIQNVALPLLYRGLTPQEAHKKAYAMLEKINIQQLANNKPNQISGGQQQRVAIARALVGDPEIILADEPTGALDSTTSQEILDLFIHLHHNENKTVIVVTHDPLVGKQCNRVIRLHDGKIISDKTNGQNGN